MIRDFARNWVLPTIGSAALLACLWFMASGPAPGMLPHPASEPESAAPSVASPEPKPVFDPLDREHTLACIRHESITLREHYLKAMDAAEANGLNTNPLAVYYRVWLPSYKAHLRNMQGRRVRGWRFRILEISEAGVCIDAASSMLTVPGGGDAGSEGEHLRVQFLVANEDATDYVPWTLAVLKLGKQILREDAVKLRKGDEIPLVATVAKVTVVDKANDPPRLLEILLDDVVARPE